MQNALDITAQRRLDEIGESVRRRARTMVGEAAAMGAELAEAKALLPHGGWLPWLAENGIRPRTAQRWMQLAAADPALIESATGIQDALYGLVEMRPEDASEENIRPSWTLDLEQTPIEELKPHPSHYREHPEEQLEHLAASLKEHGIYRNVVAANDGTILAGHGLVEAARRIGLESLPVSRLACGPDDPRAIKVLAGDNELVKLGAVDDRLLTDLLKDVGGDGDGGVEALLGTGFSPNTLAALVMTTRPESEIEHYDAAAEWVGMPAYQEPENRIKLILTFETLEDRQELLDLLEIEHVANQRWTMTAWWPDRGERQDLKSLLFASADEDTNLDG